MFRAFFLSLLFAAPALAVEESVCAAHELALFDCTRKEKRYVVCGSEDAQFLSYRVTSKSKEVFRFPATKQPLTGLFTYQLMPRGGVLSFDKGSYHYSLYSDASGSRIDVTKNDKPISSFECEQEENTGLDYTWVIDWMKKAALAK